MRLYFPLLLGCQLNTENTRPTYVVEDLSELTAPIAGTVTLPVVLNWTPIGEYDTSDIVQRKELYETVLAEALSEDDVKGYVNGDELLRVWKELRLPRRVRYAWESVHPVLSLNDQYVHN
jgi:hypothetical protein